MHTRRESQTSPPSSTGALASTRALSTAAWPHLTRVPLWGQYGTITGVPRSYKTTPSPRATIGPYAESYRRVLAHSRSRNGSFAPHAPSARVWSAWYIVCGCEQVGALVGQTAVE